MHWCRIVCVIAGLAAVAGCSREQTGPCDPEARYAVARSAQPVQIPDDLSPPNESDAIRLPPDISRGESITAGECLETPPPFFGDSRPFVDEADGEQLSRRERRRQARAEEAAGSAAPAEQREAPPETREPPPPANDDRVIDN
jgi:hypothetical protein